MSTRYYSDPEMLEPGKPSACANFLRYTWKTITCLFSHITLVTMVVSYCILGAFTFRSLEEENEKNVKRNIGKMRSNITDELWKLTTKDHVLMEENFTRSVIDSLKDFETALLKAITKDGWDGDENTENVQWSLAGALFYSIIVITTIGYGHIAPKTTWGKVVTIFYAILGIPLMLLCLSNIGDIMATSFRFLYWKVCCYVCTKKPKRPKRGRATRGTIRLQGSRNLRSRTTSFKRGIRTSTRSADSGFALSDLGPSSHSDTELRYHDETPNSKRGPSLPRMQVSQRSRYSDDAPSIRRPSPNQKLPMRGGSLDRRRGAPKSLEEDFAGMAKAPVYCNRYVVDQNEILGNHIPGTNTKGITYDERPRRQNSPQIPERRAVSMPRSQHYLEPPRDSSPAESSLRDEGDHRKMRKQNYSSSPRIMSPLGYGHKSKYLDDTGSDDEYYYDDYMDTRGSRIKPVPIWLCVLLVYSYIVAGTFLFSYWEGWEYLDSAYFCFITLTTIGFGDFVPAKRVKTDEFKKNIAFCSLYLLFGIALLAMSFNLVQEEVIANVKRVAKTLGIIKEDEEEEEDEE